MPTKKPNLLDRFKRFKHPRPINSMQLSLNYKGTRYHLDMVFDGKIDAATLLSNARLLAIQLVLQQETNGNFAKSDITDKANSEPGGLL